MKYYSTRDKNVSLSAAEAVKMGLSRDGGLLTPTQIPQIDRAFLERLIPMEYAQRAAKVMALYLTDYSEEELLTFSRNAYGPAQFDDPIAAPVRKVEDGLYCLELWHGPTSAFKDMALQMLPQLLSAALRKTGEKRTACILAATSGDTGKAAMAGFADVPQTCIQVYYPKDGVSPVQERQMVTQEGENVDVRAVIGNFDDAQAGVKRIFSDEAVRAELDKRGYFLSSANSINWGRILPQVVYYISAYCDLVRDGALTMGDKVNFCVPTGNFGNILAAWYAKQIGVPIERLLCASNDNRVLTDFINTGTYDISDREFILTSSPSMDILVSSNLERQLFELTGRNGEAIRQWMADLADARCFRVDAETFRRVRENFSADSVDNATCLATIREVLDAHDYLLDPHTAVAYAAAQNLRGENPVLIASTAHWAKFGNNVYRALHGIEPSGELPADVAALTGCELNKLIAEETGKHHIPAGLANLDTMQVRFTEVIDNDVEAIEDAAEAFLAR